MRYLTFRLTYEGSELVIRSGLLFRNERHVPYDRIQNLDATRSVLHRALGVAEVRIETGGGPEPEARISVLRESEFEEMRRRVFAGRARAGDVLTATDEAAPATPAVAVPEPQTSHTLLQLPLRELLLLGVLDNRGFLFIVAAYGVLWESGLQGRLWDQVTATFSAPGLLSSMWGGLMKGQLPSLGLLVIMAGGLLALVARRAGAVDGVGERDPARLPPHAGRQRSAHRVRVAHACDVDDSPRTDSVADRP